MSNRSNPVMFFQSMFELYEVLPLDKQPTVINQLVIFGRFPEFVEFLSSKLNSSNFSPTAAKVLIDILSNYIIECNQSLETTVVNNYVAFLLKVLALKTKPSSIDRFGDFMGTSFKLVSEYNQESLFKKVKSIGTENSIIAVAEFAVKNTQFVGEAFTYILSQTDSFFKSQKTLAWVVAFSTVLTVSEKVEIDEKKVLAAFSHVCSATEISIFRKMTMLNNATQYFNNDFALSLVESHFLSLIRSLTATSVPEDITRGIELATSVLKLTKEGSGIQLDSQTVKNAVFGYIAELYTPSRLVNDALTVFCNEIEKTEMQQIVDAMATSGNVNTCTMFLIARYPSPSTLPILFGKRSIGDLKSQYISVFHFLSNNAVPFRFLPRLFELLRPNDIHFLDEVFEEKPVLYCIAAIKYLVLCTNVDKMDVIANVMTKVSQIPIIASKYCQMAFAIVSVLRVYSKQNSRSIRVLLDYLHSCVVFSKEKGIEASYEDLANDGIVCLSDEDTDLLKMADEKMFSITTSLERTSATGYCQAQVIRDWCLEDPEIGKAYMEYATARIQNGDLSYTLMLASLSDDIVVLHKCLESVRNDEHLLVFFFSAFACCNPNLALPELKLYIISEPKQPSTFMGRFLGSSKPVDKGNLAERQKIGRRVILSMAPFVPCTQLLLDVLVATLPEQGSNKIHLVCESIVAICERLTHRELLHFLLERLLAQYRIYPVDLLVNAMTTILEHNDTLTEQLVNQMLDIWIQLLLTKEVPFDTKFEQAIFDPYYKNIGITTYLKKLEMAIVSNNESIELFLSLKRMMNLKVFESTYLDQFVALFIGNSLSNVSEIAQFCVSMLQHMYNFDTPVDVSKLKPFSFDYMTAVRPFFTNMASKFTGSNSTALFSQLMDLFKISSAETRVAIVLFSMFLVMKNPKVFIKAKEKFVGVIVSTCGKMKRKTDSPIMMYFSKILDLMATADTAAFYDQFLIVDDNEFSNLYLHRFVRSPVFAESIATVLLKQLHELKNFHGKKNSDFVMFPRVLLLLRSHVKYFVTEATSDERMASILFGMILLLSCINNMRQRSLPYEHLLDSLKKVFNAFGDNTGIDLSNGGSIDVSTDEAFCQTIANFVSFMHLMSSTLVDAFVDKIQVLQRTHQSIPACIICASLLRQLSSRGTDASAKLSEKILKLYLTLLKSESYPDHIVLDSITRGAPAFTFDALLGFTAENLTKLLTITMDAMKNSTETSIQKCMTMLLNVLRAANSEFLMKNAHGILKVLRNVITAKTMELNTVPMLNVIGELTKKVKEPSWFLTEDPISFYSLIPLIVDPCPKLNQRAIGIFSVVIFNKSSGFDRKLLFSSLMSIFCGIQHETSHYVAMAVHLMETLDKMEELTFDHLDLLSSVMEPMLSVGDANCSAGLNELLKFLRKHAQNPDLEISTKVMSLMAHFATPKQSMIPKHRQV